MKKFLSLLFLLVITLTSVILCGCAEKDDGRELLMIQPTYVGDTVTDIDHTFKKEDFKLYAHYNQNVTEEVTDFTFEVVELNGGLFTILFRWNGCEEEYYVPLKMDIYE